MDALVLEKQSSIIYQKDTQKVHQQVLKRSSKGPQSPGPQKVLKRSSKGPQKVLWLGSTS